MGFNGNQITEYKDGNTVQTGTRALGSIFNAEFNRLYANDNYLKTKVDYFTRIVNGEESFVGSITTPSTLSSSNFRTISNSTYCGVSAGNSGSWNVAIGNYALRNNTGSSNTAIGAGAGDSCTTGYDNVLIGYQAGANLTTGHNNILIGYGVNAETATSNYYLNIGDTILGNVQDHTISIEGTTESTGISTGTVVIKGGVGIAKNCYIGTSLVVGVNTFIVNSNTSTIGIGSSESSSFKMNVSTSSADSYFVDSVGGVMISSSNQLTTSGCQTLSGLSINLANPGNGAVNNAYGIYGTYQSKTNITNCYGIYFSNETKNYFSGRVGIGQANPEYMLDVTGEMRVTSTLYISQIGSNVTFGESAVYIDVSSNNLGIGTTTFGSGGNGILALKTTNAPTSSIEDGIQLFSVSISDDATLGLYTEASPVAETTYTKFSHKLPIQINGSTYYMMLTTT